MEREHIAALLMAGLLTGSGPRVFDLDEAALEERASAAVRGADALLRALGKPPVTAPPDDEDGLAF